MQPVQMSLKMFSWRPKRHILLPVVFALVLLGAGSAQALGLDVLAGGFLVEAKAGGNSGNVANLGSYRLAVGQEIVPKFEASIGYTLMASEILGGSLSYGFDFTGVYFPTRLSRGEPVSAGNIQYSLRELWQPYVGAGFHQRQFQSVRSHYAGFGVSAGVLRALPGDLSFKGELRYIMLSGPSNGQGSELSIVAGVRIQL